MVKPVPYDPSMPDRHEVEAFGRMSDDEKFLAGPRLFDLACRIVLDGIRHENPRATQQDQHRMLRDRVELMRRQEGDVDE
jgi:hypothetical protein